MSIDDDTRARMDEASVKVNTSLSKRDFEFLQILFNSPSDIIDVNSGDVISEKEIQTILGVINAPLTIFPTASSETLTEYEVISLGKQQTNGQDDTEGEDNISLSRRAAAAMLLASGKAFELKVEKNGNNPTKFHLSVDEETGNTLSSRLRSCFGAAEIKQSITKPYKYISYASCKRIILDDIKEQGSQNPEDTSNWPSALGKAILNKNFTVSLRFDPIYDGEISKKIASLSEKYLYVTNHDNITLQSSLSSTNTTAFQDNLPKKLAVNFAGGENKSGGTNHSFSLSNVRKNAIAEHLIKSIQNELIRLYVGEMSGAWGVTLRIDADDDKTLPTLKAIMAGALAPAQLSLSWSDEGYSKPKVNPKSYITQLEAVNLVQFPDSNFDGFELLPTEDLALRSPSFDVLTGDTGFNVGNILWNGTELTTEFRINKKAFTRHTFVCGMTGSGKTNTVFHLLEKTDVPYLVIEPVKGEYRRLDVTTHTMNPLDENALRINPFWFPEGGSLQYHIDALKTIISSAFTLYAAMPNILEQCIYKVYVNKGWSIVKGNNIYSGLVPDEYLYPTFSDLCHEVSQFLERSDYEGETLSTYKGALLTRLQSFTTGSKSVLLNTTDHVNYGNWLTNKTVIELDALSNDSDKSIVMGTLLIQYYQYLKLHSDSNENLRHLLIIEEAHRLFKNTSSKVSSEESANPEGQLVDTLSNMMAEIRAYGEGLIIVDQSPSKVAEDVIKNSSTKIVHRVDNRNDIEMLKATLLLGNQADTLVPGLKQGTALIRTEGMKKSAKIKVPLSKVKEYRIAKDTPRENTSNLDDIATADYILANDMFIKDLQNIMRKCINHLFYDNLYLAKEFMGSLFMDLHRLLFIHGYGQLSGVMNAEFYTRVLLQTLTAEMKEQYPSQGLLTIRTAQFFERILSIYLTQSIREKECDILMDYRSNNIHTILLEIFLNTQYQCRDYAGIISVCGYKTIYCDLLRQILVSNEWKKHKNDAPLSIEEVERKFRKIMQSFFLAKPDSLLIQNIVEKLYKILPLRIDEGTNA